MTKNKAPPAFQTILRLFFKPIIPKVELRDDGTDPCLNPFSEKLAILMGVKERGIDLFESNIEFSLPGAKLIRANKPDRRAIDSKERKIEKGFKFMVRIDSRVDFVDVQFYKNKWDKAGDERVFRLTQAEWNAIKDNLIQIKES